MSMTRFMSSSSQQHTTSGINHTQISYFTANNDVVDATSKAANNAEHVTTYNATQALIFDCTNMSRDSIRRHIRQERNAISQEQQQQLALSASQHLLAEIVAMNANKVALYLAFDGELATAPLIDALWQRDIEVYLPLIHPFAKGHLLFMRYTPDTPMVNNRFNITEPKLDVRQIVTTTHLDMIVTPLVAFDEQGNRMGMGGGFYDRTLASTGSGKPLAVGYAHDCQQVSQVPTECWDIALPVIITPTKRIANDG